MLAGTLYFILGDHLGSTSLVTSASGLVVSQTQYKAWGEVRYNSGTNPTNYTYTGQYSYTADFGLMFYNARWYDSSLGRFAQADTIVPAGVQGYDRYAYVNNNPIRYKDPSGHRPCDGAYGCRNEQASHKVGRSDKWHEDKEYKPISTRKAPISITFTPSPGWNPNFGTTPTTFSYSSPYASTDNFSIIWTVGDATPNLLFLSFLNSSKKSGNLGLSGNWGFWGLAGRYYRGKTISTAFLKNFKGGAVPLSILQAAVTNGVDYTVGPHASEGIGQGYAASTTVDATTNVLGSGIGLGGGALLLGAGITSPFIVVPAVIVLSVAGSEIPNRYFGEKMETNMNNLIDVWQGEKKLRWMGSNLRSII